MPVRVADPDVWTEKGRPGVVRTGLRGDQRRLEVVALLVPPGGNETEAADDEEGADSDRNVSAGAGCPCADPKDPTR
jgi:hypothetical protein